MFRSKHITTIGSCMQDIFVYTREGIIVKYHDILCPELLGFERAAKIPVEKLMLTYGGGASNTAVTFARLGLSPSIIAALGDDAAATNSISHLREEGVAVQELQHSRGLQTGTALILYSTGAQSHVLFVSEGASSRLQLSAAVVHRILSPWVYLTALRGNWQAGFSRLLAQCKQKHIRLAWNPGKEQIAHGSSSMLRSLSDIEVFMVNHDEALELVMQKHRVNKSLSARECARLLGAYGARYTVVTDGHRGAYVSLDKKILHQPAKIGKTINKTGAGDAFGSAFVAGLIRYRDVKKALRLAMYNSHSVVGQIGAQTGILHSKDLSRLSLS